MWDYILPVEVSRESHEKSNHECNCALIKLHYLAISV